MNAKSNRDCINICIKFQTLIRQLTLMLCRWLGIPVLPAGWMMFDPALAADIGLPQAVVYQKIRGWVEHNERRGRNQKAGKTWTYNSIPDWQKEFRWVHEKTVGRYLKDLRDRGLLIGDQLSPNPTDRRLWYTVTDRSADGSQLLLWPEQKAVMGGAIDSGDSSIGSAKAKPSKAKRNPTTRRASATVPRKGVVAGFDAHQTGEFSDKAEMPEPREPNGDDADRSPLAGMDATPTPLPSPSSAPPPPAVPKWMKDFWTECTPEELQEMLLKYGEARLEAEKYYAIDARGVTNPAGFARWRLAQGLATADDEAKETAKKETWSDYVSDESFEDEVLPIWELVDKAGAA